MPSEEEERFASGCGSDAEVAAAAAETRTGARGEERAATREILGAKLDTSLVPHSANCSLHAPY